MSYILRYLLARSFEDRPSLVGSLKLVSPQTSDQLPIPRVAVIAIAFRMGYQENCCDFKQDDASDDKTALEKDNGLLLSEHGRILPDLIGSRSKYLVDGAV